MFSILHRILSIKKRYLILLAFMGLTLWGAHFAPYNKMPPFAVGEALRPYDIIKDYDAATAFVEFDAGGQHWKVPKDYMVETAISVPMMRYDEYMKNLDQHRSSAYFIFMARNPDLKPIAPQLLYYGKIKDYQAVMRRTNNYSPPPAWYDELKKMRKNLQDYEVLTPPDRPDLRAIFQPAHLHDQPVIVLTSNSKFPPPFTRELWLRKNLYIAVQYNHPGSSFRKTPRDYPKGINVHTDLIGPMRPIPPHDEAEITLQIIKLLNSFMTPITQ